MGLAIGTSTSVGPSPGLLRRIGIRLGIVKGKTFRIAPAYQSLTVASFSQSMLDFSEPAELIARLSAVNTVLKQEASLQGPVFSRQEALVQLASGQKAVLIGDLHGNVQRLDEILQHYGPQLTAGQITLVFLGDLLHCETTQNTANTASSLQILNAVMTLKQAFPERVHLLLGNHDVISRGEAMGITKHGVPQAITFTLNLKDFLRQKGFNDSQVDQAIEEYQSFFDRCPLAFVSCGSPKATFAAHSSIIVGGATLNDIANARSNGLVDQLTFNSCRHANTGPGQHYAEGHIPLMSRRLGLTADPQDTFLISGHMPNKAGFCYAPFPNQPNHLVVHSNVHNFGVIEVMDGRASVVALSTTGPRV